MNRSYLRNERAIASESGERRGAWGPRERASKGVRGTKSPGETRPQAGWTPRIRIAGSRRLAFAVLALTLFSGSAFAQQSVFLVRHAERADAKAAASPAMKADPDLSEIGRARAETLAAMLIDAKIAAIISTEYKRTQQTAAPLAKALGLAVTTIKANESENVVQAVRSTAGNVLIIGHSNTIPEIIKALGAAPPDPIGDNDYDNLYVLTAGTPPTVVRLHFKP
jgi:phosphohistidine phosphatase SixA